MGKNHLRRNKIADRVATMRCCDGVTVVFMLLCAWRPSLEEYVHHIEGQCVAKVCCLDHAIGTLNDIDKAIKMKKQTT
jgi:hypothetical protein